MADPASTDVLTPDEELALVDADLDDGTEVAVVTDETPPPLGRSWAWDHSADTFLHQPGSSEPQATYGDQTLAQWILKTLRTARGAHPIYPSDYGMAYANRWTGRHLTGSDLAQLESAVHDALTYHPRIVDVTNFDFEQDPDEEFLVMSCDVVKDDSALLRMENVPLDPGETS